MMSKRAHPAPLFAVGVSLGGSALLNWLGRASEQKTDTEERLGEIEIEKAKEWPHT